LAHTNVDRIGWRPFLFSRTGSQYSVSGGPSIALNHRGEVLGLTITTVGWSLAPLLKFADICHEFHLKSQTGTTTIHLATGVVNEYNGIWQSVSKGVRKLETIDMDEKVKLDIIRDAEHYYSEQS
jgi:mitochondrial chaperone BCS1